MKDYLNQMPEPDYEAVASRVVQYDLNTLVKERDSKGKYTLFSKSEKTEEEVAEDELKSEPDDVGQFF